MGKRKRYSAEMQVELVRLVRAGRTPEQLAAEFEPSAQAIRNWVKQAELDEGTRTDGLKTEEREELARLRRENARLKEEREILSKAAGLVRAGDREEVKTIFFFIDAHQAMFSIRAMCRVLEVSASGYYAWRRRMISVRTQENEKLQQRIRTIHDLSRQTYGAPRIHAELKDEGTHVGRKRVARLMKESGLAGVSRRKSTVTTRRSRSARPAPDLVDRQFAADKPNELGCGHHVCPDVGGVPLSGRRPRRVEPQDRRLGDGLAPENISGHGSAGHGHHPTIADKRDSSLRSRLPIHVNRVRQALSPGRHSSFDGLGRRLL
jgi:transposase-like protein